MNFKNLKLSNYKYRLIFYKFLEKLPKFLGDQIYLKMQLIFGQAKPQKYLNSGTKFKDYLGLENLKDGVSIIEIGTGWFPIVPYLVIDYLSFNQYERFKLYSYDLRRLCSDKNKFITQKALNLTSEIFKRFHYFPETDLTKHAFNEVDKEENIFIFSKATLQHIPPEIIKNIHLNLIRSFPTHKIVHLINCNDHRWQTDKGLSKYEFLKYHELQWQESYSRFDYHNRMRIIEYINLFEELNYNIESIDFEKASQSDIDEYKEQILPYLDDRFKGFSTVENTAGSLLFRLTYNS